METPNLVLGLLGIVFGVAFILGRQRLADYQRRRTPEGTGSIPSSGWVAGGVLFLVTGLLQLINGVN